MSKKQLSNPGWWTLAINLFMGLFTGKDPVEKAKADVIESDNLVSKTEAETQAEIIETKADIEIKEIKRTAKRQRGINRKINKDKKGFEVENLKVDKPMYIKYAGVRKRDTKIYAGYDDKFIYDSEGKKYQYGMVFNYHGRPIMKPSKVAK